MMQLNSYLSDLLKSCCCSDAIVPGLTTLDKGCVDQLRCGIETAFDRFSKDDITRKSPLIRSYKNNSRSFKIDDRLLSSHNFLQDLSHICEDETDEINVLITDINRWNDELSASFANLRNSLPEKIDSKIVDLRLSAIIGNRGYTPFGIHSDGPGRFIIHIPIVGEGKKLHIMEPQKYEVAIGHQGSSTDFASLIPKMDEFQLRSNSAVFFPGNWFHVFSYNGFSITIVLIIKPLSRNAILNRVRAESYCAEIIGTTVMEKLYNGSSEPSNDCSFSLREWSRKSTDFITMRDLSSLGFLTEITEEHNEASKFVRMHKPFEIQYCKDDHFPDIIHLFGRGERFEVPNSDNVVRFLDSIKSGKKIELSSIRNTECLEICSILYRYGAIEGVN